MSENSAVALGSLVEAFQQFGAGASAGGAREAQEKFARVLLAEVTKAAYKEASLYDLGSAEAEDLAAKWLCNAFVSGPRGLREGDPDSDQRVRAYIRMSIRNARIDEYSRKSRQLEVGIEDIPEDVEGMFVTTDPSAMDGASGELLLARRQLEVEIVPRVAARKRANAQQDFLVQFRDLVAIHEGITSFDAILEVELDKARSTSVQGEIQESLRERATNRLYKRYSRVIATLHAEVAEMANRGEATSERTAALAVVLSSIRLLQNQSK